MKRLSLLALLIASRPLVAADPCEAMLPNELRQAVERRFRNDRVSTSADTPEEDRRAFSEHGGNTCLLVASADFDGDGRVDRVLVLPSKKGRRFRLVVALHRSAGWSLASLREWDGSHDNPYVEIAPPGIYRHTEAYDFVPEPSALEQLSTKRPGFYFGKIESAAMAYFLHSGRWVHIYVSD